MILLIKHGPHTSDGGVVALFKGVSGRSDQAQKGGTGERRQEFQMCILYYKLYLK